jgi:hypothetical protein
MLTQTLCYTPYKLERQREIYITMTAYEVHRKERDSTLPVTMYCKFCVSVLKTCHRTCGLFFISSLSSSLLTDSTESCIFALRIHCRYTAFFCKVYWTSNHEFHPSYKRLKSNTLYMPWGYHEVQSPRFRDSRHVNFVSLRNRPPLLIYVKRLSRLQRCCAAKSFMSMENSSDTMRNRTCDLPACSAVPPTNCSTVCPSPKLWLYKNPIPTSQKHSKFPLQLPARWCLFGEIIAFLFERILRNIQYTV